MDPQGVTVTGFKQPTPDENAHDFLWRVHPHVPGLGEVAVLLARITRTCWWSASTRWCRKRVDDALRRSTTGRSCSPDNNTTILKFFLYLSPEEQLTRFRQHLDDPTRQGKISEADDKERAYWYYYSVVEGATLDNARRSMRRGT